MTITEFIERERKVMAGATERPWFWEFIGRSKGGTSLYLLGGAPYPVEGGRNIPCVLDGAVTDDLNDTGVAGSAINMAAIVTAVNNYETVLAALEQMREALEKYAKGEPGFTAGDIEWGKDPLGFETSRLGKIARQCLERVEGMLK